jgi:hypothetical protein
MYDNYVSKNKESTLMSNLEQQIKALNVNSEELDCIVHDAASEIASKVNNEGVSSQISFLKNALNLTDSEVIKIVKTNGY